MGVDFTYVDGSTAVLAPRTANGSAEQRKGGLLTTCSLGPDKRITNLTMWSSRPGNRAPALPDTSIFGGLEWTTTAGQLCAVGPRAGSSDGYPTSQEVPFGGGVLAGGVGAWMVPQRNSSRLARPAIPPPPPQPLLGVLTLALFPPVTTVTVRHCRQGHGACCGWAAALRWLASRPGACAPNSNSSGPLCRDIAALPGRMHAALPRQAPTGRPTYLALLSLPACSSSPTWTCLLWPVLAPLP